MQQQGRKMLHLKTDYLIIHGRNCRQIHFMLRQRKRTRRTGAGICSTVQRSKYRVLQGSSRDGSLESHEGKRRSLDTRSLGSASYALQMFLRDHGISSTVEEIRAALLEHERQSNECDVMIHEAKEELRRLEAQINWGNQAGSQQRLQQIVHDMDVSNTCQASSEV